MDELKEKFKSFTKTGKIKDYLEYLNLKKRYKINRGITEDGIKRRDNS